MFKAIYHLFFGKRYEFYLDCTLEDAIFRLRTLHQKGYKTLRGKKTNERSLSITPDYHFQCQENFGENINIFCKGCLQQHGTGVSVAGQTYLGVFSRIFLVFASIWLIIWIVGTIINQAPLLTLLGIAVVSFIFLSMVRYQNELHNSLHNKFGKSKKKKR